MQEETRKGINQRLREAQNEVDEQTAKKILLARGKGEAGVREKEGAGAGAGRQRKRRIRKICQRRKTRRNWERERELVRELRRPRAGNKKEKQEHPRRRMLRIATSTYGINCVV